MEAQNQNSLTSSLLFQDVDRRRTRPLASEVASGIDGTDLRTGRIVADLEYPFFSLHLLVVSVVSRAPDSQLHMKVSSKNFGVAVGWIQFWRLPQVHEI